MLKLQNYMNGQHSSPTSQSVQYLDVTTPHTGAVIAQVPLSTAADVTSAINHAHQAFHDWSSRTLKFRTQILIRFHQLVAVKYADELAEMIVREHGKTRAEAMAEIMKGIETVEYAMSLPQLAQGRYLEVSRGVYCHDERCALGVVASIVPFNFPFMVPFWTIGHALVMGNTMILKPSDKVPMTMSRVMDIFKEAGLPDGVLNIVHGTADVVNAICDNPAIKAVTFVGTSKVAELVTQRCHALNKRVLALGGAKNHLVAAPDCHVDMTATDVLNSFSGCSGERCMAASVLLTIGDRKDLVQAIVEKASKITPGSEAGQMGPVIDQVSREKIAKYIEEAVAKYGAELVLDGRSWMTTKSEGWWIGPTVLICKSPTDPAMTDEIFGPVLSIYVCKTAEEALSIENGNPYGNAACIYTETGKTAEYFTQRFKAGMLGVNIGVPVPREPFSFGGIGKSSFGCGDITGDAAIEFFSYRKKVTTKWTKPAHQTWLN